MGKLQASPDLGPVMAVMLTEKDQGMLNIESSGANVAVDLPFNLGVIEFFEQGSELRPFLSPIGPEKVKVRVDRRIFDHRARGLELERKTLREFKQSHFYFFNDTRVGGFRYAQNFLVHVEPRKFFGGDQVRQDLGHRPFAGFSPVQLFR